MAEPTVPQVLEFQIRQQHGMTLRSAEALLQEVTDCVKRLRDGNVPSTSVNASTVGRVLTDHAKLQGLLEALETVKSIENAKT